MNAKQNTIVEMIPFTSAKTTIAREATASEAAAYALGFELGAEHAESQTAWAQALKTCKSPTDRKSLRAGFIAGYVPFCGNVKRAQNRFDYLARMFSPHTSRKAKANGAKRGRKEKAEKAVAVMSEKTLQRNVVACLAYVANMQAKHAADGDMLEVLGKVASILAAK